jgi:hypothetical protein
MATPLRGNTLPAGVIVGTGFSAIVLAIPLNALLALDFTRTWGAFAFHFQFSFPKKSKTNSLAVYFLR